MTLSVELLQDLFVAADRYSLHKLTLLCEEKLEKNLSVDRVLTTLLVCAQISVLGLRRIALLLLLFPKTSCW
jgi:hypothetical protein